MDVFEMFIASIFIWIFYDFYDIIIILSSYT